MEKLKMYTMVYLGILMATMIYASPQYNKLTSTNSVTNNLNLTGVCLTNQTGCNYTGISGGSDNSSWNETRANLLYAPLVTNFPSCSAGQVLTNLTGSLTCVTPTASVVRNINYTTTNSVNATGLSFVTLFTTSLSANTNYTYDCYLVRSSNVTTSGITYNLTFSGTVGYVTLNQVGHTTATAVQNNICQGSVKSCTPTAITASLAYPTGLTDKLNAYIETGSGSGQMNLTFAGELATLRATIQRGSYCELQSI